VKSRNFEFLRPNWQELAALGGFAEAYAHADPASALVKLRLFAENLTKDIYRDLSLPKPAQTAFVDLLTNDSFQAITPKVVHSRQQGRPRRTGDNAERSMVAARGFRPRPLDVRSIWERRRQSHPGL